MLFSPGSLKKNPLTIVHIYNRDSRTIGHDPKMGQCLVGHKIICNIKICFKYKNTNHIYNTANIPFISSILIVKFSFRKDSY